MIFDAAPIWSDGTFWIAIGAIVLMLGSLIAIAIIATRRKK